MNWYSYAANNPVAFVDPTGEKIQLPENETDRKEFMSLLRELSHDILFVKEETDAFGNTLYFVEVDTECLGSKKTGTKLIRQLINNSYTARLQFVEKLSDGSKKGGEVIPTNWDDTFEAGNGASVTVSMTRVLYKALTKGNKDKEARETTTPMYISLGHELIHALRQMKGHAKSTVKQRSQKYWYTVEEGDVRLGRNIAEEELDTVGINYIAQDGTTRYAWTWEFTENALRDEHGLPRRISYP